MYSPYDLPEIIERYRHYYNEALQTGVHKLPYYEIQHWDKVLHPVELRIYQDIKAVGIPLYPIFPLSEYQYLHFANPFNRVGLQIVYKTSDRSVIQRKLALYKSTQNWKIYEIDSTKTFYTFEQYCDFRKTEFDDLNEEEQFAFHEKYREGNDYCLLQYMKAIHFEKNFQLID